MIMSNRQILEYFETDKIDYAKRGVKGQSCVQVAGTYTRVSVFASLFYLVLFSDFPIFLSFLFSFFPLFFLSSFLPPVYLNDY